MAASQVMRITLKAYDHQLIDASAKSIIETVKKTGSKVSGRLIDIITPSQKTVDALSKLEVPAGVYIDIKMKNK